MGTERDEVLDKIRAEVEAWRALPDEEKKRIENERHNAVNDSIRRRESQVAHNNEQRLRKDLGLDRRVGR